MRVRHFDPKDFNRYTELLAEMERHYGGGISIDTVRERFRQRYVEMTDLIFLVAEEDRELVGHASMSPLFPAGSAKVAYFVKDIFVSDSSRGKGIGTALLKACAAEAKERGAYRLDLTVDANNPEATRLYEHLGAKDTHKRYLRWDADTFSELAGRQTHV